MNFRTSILSLPACLAALLVPIVAGGEESAPPSEFIAQVNTFFGQWDTSGDGELSKVEIESAVADPANQGKGAAAIAALRRSIRGKTFVLPPLTHGGIASCVPHRKEDKTLPDFDAMYQTALRRITEAKRELFTGAAPALDALHQGKLGDCFCLAPLGAMLHRNPQDVTAMFAPEGDARVAVTFGGRDRVSVPLPTDAEIALLASTTSTGLWANVYEKAVGQYRYTPEKAQERPTALSVVAVGGSAGTIVQLVTGRKITRFSCKPWREAKTTEGQKEELLGDLRSRLATAMNERKLVCGGVDSGTMRDGRKVPGVLGNHAYAILHYDREHDVATLWNPHGDNFTPKADSGLTNGYPMRGGRFDVPLTELVEFFGGFSFETAEAL